MRKRNGKPDAQGCMSDARVDGGIASVHQVKLGLGERKGQSAA